MTEVYQVPKEDIKEIKDGIKDIFRILNGNGKAGLCTQVALNCQKLKDIPSPNSLRFHASVGSGIVMVIALFGYMIYQVVAH
jgi:hypothetical protein